MCSTCYPSGVSLVLGEDHFRQFVISVGGRKDQRQLFIKPTTR
ncbi:hypothetical protein [Nitrosopumilus sp.]|nr:hypothetical protein [Nitrosopumilus sp.]